MMKAWRTCWPVTPVSLAAFVLFELVELFDWDLDPGVVACCQQYCFKADVWPMVAHSSSPMW